MPMRDTARPCWPAGLLKRLSPISVVALTACCANGPGSVPNLPAPAADLMLPAPTGSALSEHVSRNMSDWAAMLQAGPTR